MNIPVFNSWKGSVQINDNEFLSNADLPSDLCLTDNTIILLKTKNKQKAVEEAKASGNVYKVSVRQYMLNKGTVDFDFMQKWNNDVPMPLRTMIGTIEKETSGMYYMKLKADTNFDAMQFCMRCGKEIRNPVSQYFGLGPECGGHNYVNPFGSDAELRAAVKMYKQEYLSKIAWEGWVIKRAIISMTLVENSL